MPTHFAAKLIDSGRDGAVYTTPFPGYVIKVTKAKTEVCIAYAIRDLQRRGILGHGPGHGFPLISAIWEENGQYVIQRHDVPDADDPAKMMLAATFLSTGWSCGMPTFIDRALEMAPQLAPLLADLRTLRAHWDVKVLDIGSEGNVGRDFLLRDFSRGVVPAELMARTNWEPEDVVADDDADVPAP